MARLRFDVRQAGRVLLAVGLLLALANLAGWFVFTRPVVRSYRELNQESQQYKKIQDRRDQVTHRSEYLSALEQAEEDLRYLHEEVLSTRSARLVEVQEELKELTDRFDINLAAVNYESETLLDEGLERLAIDVPLQGNYIALRRFLEAVEESDKFLLVERVVLNKGKEGGVGLELGITLTTYFNTPEWLQKRKQELERTKRRGQT